MESSLVSARIPVAKKEAGAGLLRSLGSTPSELVNRAYDYLIACGELPSVPAASRKGRQGAGEADGGLEAFLAASTVEVDWGADAAADYKELLRRGRRADYESLA